MDRDMRAYVTVTLVDRGSEALEYLSLFSWIIAIIHERSVSGAGLRHLPRTAVVRP